MSGDKIDVTACRGRQQRLLTHMQQLQLDLVVLNQREHVQYLTGVHYGFHFLPLVALDRSGHAILIAPSRRLPKVCAANDVRPYEAQWLSTLRNDQGLAAATVLLDALAAHPKPKRIGVEFSSCGPCLTQHLGGVSVDIEPTMYRLRRRKDADELALLQIAIDATGKMYEAARAMIAPGINELDVFNQLQAVAVRHCGEMLTGTGNDYASGERGGPPRNRKIEAGELYILDLGPAYRGYFADNCRVVSVGGSPTDDQLKLWEHIVPVFKYIEQTVKPGKSCRELFEEVAALLRQGDLELSHHLGHGIGLFPHETPHINPNWDDVFEAGDVFACEPGLYAPCYRMGIRLENNYLVTSTGVKLLSDFPLEL